MKLFGALFRWVMNINTIWAGMILISFIMCLVAYILPIWTPITPDSFIEGKNTLVIDAPINAKQNETFTYSLTKVDDEITTFSLVKVGDTFTTDTLAFVIKGKSDDEKTQAKKLLAALEKAPTINSIKKSNDVFMMNWRHQVDGEVDLTMGSAAITVKVINLNTFTNAILDYGEAAFNLAFGFIPIFVIFLGLMKVGEDAGLVQVVARIFYPVIRILFPDVPKDHPANGAILMNITTSVLGLGNAATPFGLKAMEHLQDLNDTKEVATNAQVMLLGYNTAGFALLPTTLIAVRKSAGCADPLAIIGTCMLAGAVATITAFVMARLLRDLPFFSRKNAVAEFKKEQAAQAALETKEEAN
jgi:spore maturation protein SpmA